MCLVSQVKPSYVPGCKVIKASPLEGINLAEDDKAAATPNSAHTTQPHVLRAQVTSFGSSRGYKRRNKTKKNRASPTNSTLEGTDRSQVSIQEVHNSSKCVVGSSFWFNPLEFPTMYTTLHQLIE